MILVLLLYLLIASTYVIGKAALVYGQPIFMTGIRMTIGGILLISYLYFFDRTQWTLKKKDIWLFAQIALFHIYISFSLEFWALAYVSSFKVAFMFNLSPFITALFAYIYFKESMSTRRWIGLIIGFIGTLPVLIAQSCPDEMQVGHFLFISLPEVALLGAVISGVYGWIVMKKLVVDRPYSPIFVNGIGMFIGGIVALATSFGFEKKPLLKCIQYATNPLQHDQSLWASLFAGSWANFLVFLFYIMLLILVANIIFYNLYGFLLKKYSQTFLSLVGLFSPCFTALMGWMFLGETVRWPFFLSLIIVFFGAYIFYKDELAGQCPV